MNEREREREREVCSLVGRRVTVGELVSRQYGKLEISVRFPDKAQMFSLKIIIYMSI